MEKEAGRVVVNVGGVGYEVRIPFSTYYELGEVGETVSLRTYTHVKEDSLSLYGFLTPQEKALFTRLIQISGIGPKLGITILSGLPVGEFVRAVSEGNLLALNRIPGVGKKTAERLMLEMKDKVAELFPQLEPSGGPPAASGAKDVISALVNLGYARAQAERAVSRAVEEEPTERFEVLLKNSLKRISG